MIIIPNIWGEKNMFQTTNQTQMNTTKASVLAASTSGNSIIPGDGNSRISSPRDRSVFVAHDYIYIIIIIYIYVYIIYIYCIYPKYISILDILDQF